jgi:hypothetical protein
MAWVRGFGLPAIEVGQRPGETAMTLVIANGRSIDATP